MENSMKLILQGSYFINTHTIIKHHFWKIKYAVLNLRLYLKKIHGFGGT